MQEAKDKLINLAGESEEQFEESEEEPSKV